ncbi:MAG TPA: hypothetical protein VLH10_01555, partial [Yinghuangia sp.]|nr:hypothetical protein [Yinghuangia sp.]
MDVPLPWRGFSGEGHGGLRGAWPGKHEALLLEDKGFSMRDVAVEVIVVGTALRVFIPDLRA